MEIRNVTIVGGSGFVGRHLARILAERGVVVTIPTRNWDRAKRELIVLPTAQLNEVNIHTDADLERVIAGADAVVNLAGILGESQRDEFTRVHVELPRRIAQICKRLKIRRLVHMSALGADLQAPSRYLRSKGAGEAAIRGAAADGPQLTMFRPSVIFGWGDSFLTMFARLLTWLPILPLGSPRARFQPVWVEDVARAMADALTERETFGQTYELCGPRVFTLRELVERTAAVTGRRRPIIGLGPNLSYAQALTIEFSPWPILTRDNVLSMRVDNVCACGWPEIFGFSPSPLEAVLPTYLEGGPRSPNYRFRERARR